MNIYIIYFYILNLGDYYTNKRIGIALSKLFFLILPVLPLLLPVILTLP